MGDFKEGIAAAETDKGWGFIDKKGNTVINFQFYAVASYFSEGKALYKEVRDYKIYEGFINTKGEKIIPARFSGAQHFSEGLAPVSNGNGWGFINEKGDLVIDYQFDWVGNFQEGQAEVTLYTKDIPLDIEEKYWIDTTGKRVGKK